MVTNFLIVFWLFFLATGMQVRGKWMGLMMAATILCLGIPEVRSLLKGWRLARRLAAHKRRADEICQEPTQRGPVRTATTAT